MDDLSSIMADIDSRTAVSRIDLGTEPEFQLGDMIVQPSQCRIQVHGVRRELQRRVMQVLVALAKAEQRVVTRDQLSVQCWNGCIVGDDALNRCILALRHLAQEFEPTPFRIETVRGVGHRLVETKSRAAGLGGRGLALAMGGAVVAALAAAASWLAWPELGGRATSAVVVLRESDPGAADVARALRSKLTAIQDIQSNPIEIAATDEGSPDGRTLNVDVELIDADTVSVELSHQGGVVWGREFQQSTGARQAFEQQMAYALAEALRCAADALAGTAELGSSSFKSYVNGCASLSDFEHDGRATMEMLRNVVRDAPRFRPGWAKLLLADLSALSSGLQQERDVRSAMSRDIAEARQWHPDIAEAYLAEFALKPGSDFVGRARIADAAVKLDPGNAESRSVRAHFLASVGLIDAASEEARIAARLNPLSPTLQAGVVHILAIASQNAAALAELRSAEQVWPSSEGLIQARYGYYLRYGDPAPALKMIREGAVGHIGPKLDEPFLKARIDPTSSNIADVIERSRAAVRSDPLWIYNHLQILAEFDRTDEMAKLLLAWPRTYLVDHISEVWFRPAFSDLHRDPRFMAIAARFGVARFWIQSGRWPDFCFDPAIPYDCKAAARAALKELK